MSLISVCCHLQTSALLSPDKGKALYQEISRILAKNNHVILDFQGCEYLSSSFLNEAIGKQLINNQWSAAEIREKICWQNLSEDDEIDLDVAIENAETKLHLIQNDINPEDFYNTNLPNV